MATLRAAKQAVEDEAAEAAAEREHAKAVRKARREATWQAEADGVFCPDEAEAAGDAAEAATEQDPDVAASAEAAADTAVPKDKPQRNFTDPDSKIMKTSDKSFHQCYNAQAIVDERHQISSPRS